MKSSLFLKLLYFASALSFITISIVIFNSFYSEALEERDSFRRMESLLSTSYRQRLEFTIHRDMKFVNSFMDQFGEFNNELRRFESNEAFADLISLKRDYLDKFEQFVHLTKIRGLNENLGFEGDFRNAVHSIESIISKNGDHSLYVEMLQARRREKDYIMRRKEQYVDDVKMCINRLKDQALRIGTNQEEYKLIESLSDNYINSFVRLVQVFKSLDSLESVITNQEKEMEARLEQNVTIRESRAELISNVQIAVVVVSIFLSLVLSIVVSKSLSKPVEELRKASMKIAEGQLDTHVNIRSKDEIGDLASAFNIMAKNIKESNQTINEQNKQLEVKKNQLESAAGELQTSLDNLHELVKIGKSITSALQHQEIFEKLNISLQSLIQSSLFGIGMYDEVEDKLIYKLIMNDRDEIAGFSLDLRSMGRFDTICFNTGRELIVKTINNKLFVKDDPDFFDNYPNAKALKRSTLSGIYLPIVADNAVIGVLTIESEAENAFSNADLDTLRNLNSYVAIAIMNSKAYEAIKKAHEDLTTAQAQLIQSEKMASLGQLTTGIAHEIKNPLNFISNFSDGTIELCNEFIEEFSKSAKDMNIEDFEKLTSSIIEIKGYLETIHKNGKRIDNIVKSMMEHARGGATDKAMTDINNLVAEYGKIAYNGFRAQYKEFKANIIFELDELKPHASLRSSDVTRVITNLVDNACYAAHQKKQYLQNGFVPEIKLTTCSYDDKVEIKIRDNGMGIPKKFVNKLFEPFFTTKPTGEGTGLGLSLSYDIIRNGHGGDISVNSEIDNYTEFVICLPK